MKYITAAVLSISAFGLTAPAFAQDAAAAPAEPAAAAQETAPAAQAAAAKAGDTVYDQAGEVVGTVESVEGQTFVISTGAQKATVPLAALANGPKGLTIGMSKAELEAAIQNAKGASAPAAPAQEAAPQQ